MIRVDVSTYLSYLESLFSGPDGFFVDLLQLDEAQRKLFYFLCILIVANSLLILVAWNHYGSRIACVLNKNRQKKDKQRRRIKYS